LKALSQPRRARYARREHEIACDFRVTRAITLLLKKPKKNKEAVVSLFLVSGFSLADKSALKGKTPLVGNIGNTLPAALQW